ncbi:MULTISPECIES: sensor histidine kinase [Tenacibaculum]|uniref:sensor histidine kinase n=1 Tax=Tenacibaculum TaxID=104267 RepID=UPI001F0A5941|nr:MULTISPECIES: ATP-binding protein [Tenacibaculum]MCH3881539.1 ATP-binding protein [Tenacibaculum aquimarinum]MDO6598866.1 ATP-binding protein [Tenacibaculum sp. 1_MG-2023]
MILLVLLASILIAAVTIYQYDEQTKEYNEKRFERKEDATKQDIEIELTRRTTFAVNTENLQHIFQNRIYEISQVHKLNITMYNMNGELLKSSKPIAFEKVDEKPLSTEIINELANSSNHRILKDDTREEVNYQSSYTYINDPKFKRIGILELQIAQDNTEQQRELEEFMSRLGFVYVFMFLIAIALAYFLSSYITRSIQTISEKIKETRLNKRNEKITLGSASSEINSLVDAYNNMIDQLEDSAVKLAQSEREQAWREMAKQVAHEIKNPLTPMRLTVQSFERKFNPEDPEIKGKMAEYSETLIQQIDVMSSIASAFSDFAKMPTQRREQLDVIDVVKHALDIFTEDYIEYIPKETKIEANLDKTQLIRIVTNLVKNATQAINIDKNPKIEVQVYSKENNVLIVVSDNGKGISEANKKLIFEPKFTTKTSGMGLGLAMIKNIIEAYNGSISFTSTEEIGTVFTVILPKT